MSDPIIFHNKIARESRRGAKNKKPDLGGLGKPAMTSFLSIPLYSPLMVLLVGLSTFVGLWGVGTALLNVLQLRLLSPWDHDGRIDQFESDTTPRVGAQLPSAARLSLPCVNSSGST